MALQAGIDGVAEPRVERTFLEAAGFWDGQPPFDETTASLALSSERELAIDHGRTQSAFGCVVGRFDASNVGKSKTSRGAYTILCTFRSGVGFR